MYLRFQNRWFYVLNICFKLQKIIDNGGMVFDEKNEIVPNFEFYDDDIFQKLNERCRMMVFDKNINHDNGMHTTIKEWKKYFKDYTYILPNHINKIGDL